MEFHAHIYYDQARREQALKLQDALQHYFSHVARVRGLEGPSGPHLWPRLEVAFHEDFYAPVRDFLVDHHGELPVLVHPLTQDHFANHGPLAQWLGQELPLDWSKIAS